MFMDSTGFTGAVVFAGSGFGYGGGFTYATTARTTYQTTGGVFLLLTHAALLL